MYEIDISNVIETVSDPSISEEALVSAITAELRLLCQCPSDDVWRIDSEPSLH